MVFDTLTDSQKRDLAAIIQVAWERYVVTYGAAPRATPTSLQALVDLMHTKDLVQGITNRAITQWLIGRGYR